MHGGFCWTLTTEEMYTVGTLFAVQCGTSPPVPREGTDFYADDACVGEEKGAIGEPKKDRDRMNRKQTEGDARARGKDGKGKNRILLLVGGRAGPPIRMPRNPRMTRQPSERDSPLALHRQTPIDQMARVLAELDVALAAPHAPTGSSVRRGRERVLARQEDVQEYAEGPDLSGEHGVGFAGKDFGGGIGPCAVESACEERW